MYSMRLEHEFYAKGGSPMEYNCANVAAEAASYDAAKAAYYDTLERMR